MFDSTPTIEANKTRIIDKVDDANSEATSQGTEVPVEVSKQEDSHTEDDAESAVIVSGHAAYAEEKKNTDPAPAPEAEAVEENEARATKCNDDDNDLKPEHEKQEDTKDEDECLSSEDGSHSDSDCDSDGSDDGLDKFDLKRIKSGIRDIELRQRGAIRTSCLLNHDIELLTQSLLEDPKFSSFCYRRDRLSNEICDGLIKMNKRCDTLKKATKLLKPVRYSKWGVETCISAVQFDTICHLIDGRLVTDTELGLLDSCRSEERPRRALTALMMQWGEGLEIDLDDIDRWNLTPPKCSNCKKQHHGNEDSGRAEKAMDAKGEPLSNKVDEKVRPRNTFNIILEAVQAYKKIHPDSKGAKLSDTELFAQILELFTDGPERLLCRSAKEKRQYLKDRRRDEEERHAEMAGKATASQEKEVELSKDIEFPKVDNSIVPAFYEQF